MVKNGAYRWSRRRSGGGDLALPLVFAIGAYISFSSLLVPVIIIMGAAAAWSSRCHCSRSTRCPAGDIPALRVHELCPRGCASNDRESRYSTLNSPNPSLRCDNVGIAGYAEEEPVKAGLQEVRRVGLGSGILGVYGCRELHLRAVVWYAVVEPDVSRKVVAEQSHAMPPLL